MSKALIKRNLIIPSNITTLVTHYPIVIPSLITNSSTNITTPLTFHCIIILITSNLTSNTILVATRTFLSNNSTCVTRANAQAKATA
ncbi:hypothetical protein PM082_020387 [Marasmius tenuissimus]|nr:hypothetical protein PM082_020387 [Marasmius tenuissimus]